MRLSKTGLKALASLAKGTTRVAAMAREIDVSVAQVYKTVQRLQHEGLLTLSDGAIEPQRKTHITLLLQLLAKAPNLATPFSGTGLQTYVALLEPKEIADLEKATGSHRTTIFKKLRQGRKMSLVLHQDRAYRVNEKLWSDAREFLLELKRYEEVLDQRVPATATIYFKDDKEIIFSTAQDVDAEKTGFSAYGQYGIPLLLPTQYYHLPITGIGIGEAFAHSLRIAQKDPDPRHLAFVALFALKHHLFGTKHPIIENLKRVWTGEKIAGYPSWEDIKERARVYAITVPE